jgi:hypothetical protein
LTAFTFVEQPDADRDEIAAEPETLRLLGEGLRVLHPPQPESAWRGIHGTVGGFPLVVDADLPPGEVRVLRRPPVDLVALAKMVREFTIAAQPPPDVSDWCACSMFDQGPSWHVHGCPRLEKAAKA